MSEIHTRRMLLTLVALCVAMPALAQAPPPVAPPAPAPAPPTPPPPPGAVRVRLQTALGAILIDLYADKAPITAGNFLHYVDSRHFDGITFYRASRAKGAPEFGVIQGGLRNAPAKLFKPIAHESTTRTGLNHKDGTISMGRYAPGSATADFFICVGDSPYLDADPKGPGDNLGFAAFGQVVEGMDVVRAILARPVNPVGGPPGMKGEMLKPPVPILTIRRVK